MTKRIDYARVAPDAVKALSATHPYLAASAIEPRLRALVELRMSQIDGCAYCVDTHSQEARRAIPGNGWIACRCSERHRSSTTASGRH